MLRVARAALSSANAVNSPSRERMKPQSLPPVSSSRDASKVQVTGLYWATVAIQSAVNSAGIKAVERKVAGSTTKLTSTTSVSPRRVSSPMALEKAAKKAPNNIVPASRTNRPPGWLPKLAPNSRARPKMIDERLSQGKQTLYR